jgi:ectoine hydroxylase-related dioxygenase (phytanoyl-CoA dioxygenase family)
MASDMALTEGVMQKVAASMPTWIKRPLTSALSRARRVSPFAVLGTFGELPADFIGAPRVRIGHKERITARDFPPAGPAPWLDRSDAEIAVATAIRDGRLSRDEGEACAQFSRQGYFTAERLVPESVIDAAMDAYARARRDGTLHNENGDRRYLNPHCKVSTVDALMRHPGILRWVDVLLGRPHIAFQSIGSEWGSEQLEHSDAVHMTTYPLGYLVAAWVACEDVHPDSGPLMYYPGSHRLPYYLSHEVGIAPTEFRDRSYACYAEKYEPFIQRVIASSGLQREVFLPKKGDVLFWHHNLLHGGSPIKDAGLTRRAFVFHYFAKGAFCYQDLASSRFPPGRLE